MGSSPGAFENPPTNDVCERTPYNHEVWWFRFVSVFFFSKRAKKSGKNELFSKKKKKNVYGSQTAVYRTRAKRVKARYGVHDLRRA